jgi:hypothetical protein
MTLHLDFNANPRYCSSSQLPTIEPNILPKTMEISTCAILFNDGPPQYRCNIMKCRIGLKTQYKPDKSRFTDPKAAAQKTEIPFFHIVTIEGLD